jgi:biopolymer transport protein ExbD
VVVVRADKGSRHGKVVDVMDLAKRIGFNKLAIAIKAKSAIME